MDPTVEKVRLAQQVSELRRQIDQHQIQIDAAKQQLTALGLTAKQQGDAVQLWADIKVMTG
jgi:hypothetical protein